MPIFRAADVDLLKRPISRGSFLSDSVLLLVIFSIEQLVHRAEPSIAATKSSRPRVVLS